MITLYGIKNCDTVKKARSWLESQRIDYRFHDFRADGIDKTLVSQWIAKVPVDALINRRSTTWKQLSAQDRIIESDDDATRLIIAHPTLVKRPVLEAGEHVTVGFNVQTYEETLL